MKVEADAAALLWAHNENAFLKCEPAGVPGSEVRGPVEEPNPPPRAVRWDVYDEGRATKLYVYMPCYVAVGKYAQQ